MVWPCWLQQDLFRPPQGTSHDKGTVTPMQFQYTINIETKIRLASPFIIVINNLSFLHNFSTNSTQSEQRQVQLQYPSFLTNLRPNHFKIDTQHRCYYPRQHGNSFVSFKAYFCTKIQPNLVIVVEMLRQISPTKNRALSLVRFSTSILSEHVRLHTSKLNPLPIIYHSSKSRNSLPISNYYRSHSRS